MKRGVTFPELLVALLCATLVAYIAWDLVHDEQGNYTRTRAKVRTQNDAREALRIVEEDMRNTAFRFAQNRASGAKGGITPVQSNCALAPEDRLRVGDGTFTDTVIVRSFLRDGNFLPDCNRPIETRYYMVDDAANKDTTLERSFEFIGGTKSTSTVLHHVVAFQAQVGTDSTVDDQTRPSADTVVTNTQSIFPATTPVSDATLGLIGPDTLALTGFSTTKEMSLGASTLFQLQPYSTYRLSFWVMANSHFLTWQDTVLHSTLSHMSFYLASGGNDFDSLKFAPLPQAGKIVPATWTFSTDGAAKFASLNLKLLETANLSGTRASPESLYVSHIRLVRVRNTNQQINNPTWTWHNGDSGSVALRRQTMALRVWLLSKTNQNKGEAPPTFSDPIGNWNPTAFTPTDKGAYVLHERVIPLGNLQ